MIQQYIDEKSPETINSPFLLKECFSALNASLMQRPYLDKFSLGMIHFNPSDQFYTFIGSGTFALWNQKNGSNTYVRQDYTSPYLGEKQLDTINILSEGWMERDRIIFPMVFHTVPSIITTTTTQDTLLTHGSHSPTATAHALHHALTNIKQPGLFINGVLCVDNTIF